MKWLRASNLVTAGATRALRGLRTGDQRVLVSGALLGLLGWLASKAGPQRKLIFRQTIPKETALVLRHVRRDAPADELGRIFSEEMITARRRYLTR